MSIYKNFIADGLQGGTSRDLDSFPIANLTSGDRAFVSDSGNFYYFKFDSTSTAAETVASHPYYIRPDDYATSGVWVEQQAVGTGGGSGTVTSVSVVSANGISGSVANPTTTPDITLTLGAITPTTVNGLTLASAAVGFTISGGATPKTLTVPLDASVSGTNTGDSAYWTIASTVMSPTTAGNTVSIPKLDIYNVSTTGLLLANTTPSVIGRLIQYSPALQMTGTAHDDNDNVSREVHWRIENRPINGNFPSSTLNFLYALEAGSYSTRMVLYSNGRLYVGLDIEINGSLYRGSASYSKLDVGTVSTSASFYRNTNNAISVLLINNQNASSTGNICDFQWQSVNRLCVTREGNISAPHADGIKIGISTSEKLVLWGGTPIVQPTLLAYTSDAESVAYTGIDNLQAGSVYATVADLNTLRVAYDNLRAAYDDMRTKLLTTGITGSA